MLRNKYLASLAAIALAVGAVVATAAPAAATQPPTYSICHATEVVDAKNGWLALPPLPVVAIVNAGHSNHPGDIFPVIDPEFPSGQNLGTLYPNYGPGVTGADILAGGCQDSPDPQPDVATADLAFIDATCDAPQQLNLPGSSISNATWGTDTDDSDLGYNIVATADDGSAFAEGDPNSKTFSGTLDDVLDPDDPACDEDDVVVVKYEICHATEVVDAKNGWNWLDLPVVAIVNGHSDETHSGDIIPVIDPEFPTGQNLDTLYPNYGEGVTGADILAGDCQDSPDPEPELATAELAFTEASCFAAQAPDIGGSSISNATWGSDTDADPLGFEIVATADSGAEFTDGDPGNLTKTFAGTLDPIIPDDDPRCLETLGLVLPTVSFQQTTCSAAGSYTLGVAAEYDPSHVTFTVNGVSGIAAGTYQVLTPKVVTVTAQAVEPNGLEFEWVDPEPFSFVAATCVELSTLALTGTSTGYRSWAMGASALILGAALMLIRRRREALSE